MLRHALFPAALTFATLVTTGLGVESEPTLEFTHVVQPSLSDTTNPDEPGVRETSGHSDEYAGLLDRSVFDSPSGDAWSTAYLDDDDLGLGDLDPDDDDDGDGRTGVTIADTAPVPRLNRGESARFVIRDTGRAIVITGRGRGMGGDDGASPAPNVTSYVSLIYPDAACSTQENPSSLTIDGTWQNHGSNQQELIARYEGAAYSAVKGNIGSISIRAVTLVAGPQALMISTLEPRACAPVQPDR